MKKKRRRELGKRNWKMKNERRGDARKEKDNNRKKVGFHFK